MRVGSLSGDTLIQDPADASSRIRSIIMCGILRIIHDLINIRKLNRNFSLVSSRVCTRLISERRKRRSASYILRCSFLRAFLLFLLI